ncbi:formate dehydrogenase subunit gamma [Vogesella amnigena]|uniref:Formate dehydrogenase subunit gamma n=1 Tax=Vogesella amnigena TaxID=1507449 RepID=A0ABV7TYE5_9NEIS
MTTQQQARTQLQAILDTHRHEAGALLPILHALQDTLGHIPDWSVADIAQALNLSRAEVHGVITFYHHFRTSPPAAHNLQICQAEACQARGSRELTAHAEQALGCGLHGRSGSHDLDLQPVYCLGLCATGPNIMLDDKLVSRVDAARLDRLLNSVKES